MKKFILLLLVPFVLAACEGGTENQNKIFGKKGYIGPSNMPLHASPTYAPTTENKSQGTMDYAKINFPTVH